MESPVLGACHFIVSFALDISIRAFIPSGSSLGEQVPWSFLASGVTHFLHITFSLFQDRWPLSSCPVEPLAPSSCMIHAPLPDFLPKVVTGYGVSMWAFGGLYCSAHHWC